MNKPHSFKLVTYEGHRIEIDKDIVSLLKKMWALGIRTTNSCQAHCNFTCKHKYQIKKYRGQKFLDIIPTKYCYNNVWVAFESSKDVEKLYNLVAEYHNKLMYNKMSCDRFLSTGQTNFKDMKDLWSFSFILRNHDVLKHTGRPTSKDGCEKNNFVISPQITFPRDHLPYVEERLSQALKRKRK